MAVSEITRVRPAAVAGAFYPADAEGLRSFIRQMLAGETPATPEEETGKMPVPPKENSATPSATAKAIIAPHAGYVYSGPVAASVYRTLAPGRGRIRRVVMLGPSHRVAFSGLASSTATHFATPLGNVALDRAAIDSLNDLAFVRQREDAHAREHGLEVQLPFLLEVLGDFVLVPLVVGDAPTQQVAQVIDRLWGGAETLIVISSDLSHYHVYAEAVKLDAAAARAIEELRPLDLAAEQACGCVPVRALLSLAARYGLRPRTLDLRNSADTAPAIAPRDRVVGYGAWAFEGKGQGTRAMGLRAEKDRASSGSSPPQTSSSLGPWPLAPGPTLLSLARRSIEHGLATGKPLPVVLDDFDPALRELRATFVTLELPRSGGGETLRGCIGTLEARRPLVEDIAQNAFAAAFRDPRFPPVTAGEVPLLEVHLSLLTAPEPMTFSSQEDLLAQIRPGIDGLILEETRLGRRGTFLPAVWETLPDKRQFLDHLKTKAGLPASHWSDSVRVWRYIAEVIGD